MIHHVWGLEAKLTLKQTVTEVKKFVYKLASELLKTVQ
jgi:hypothetical protein